MNNQLNYDFLEHFKEQSVALRLLRSQNFSLISSFFYRAFISKNRRAMPYQELVGLLDHHLSDIADTHGDARYPKAARAYIDDWINAKGGFLRKYLAQHSDEPECDLLPEVEKALRWLDDMQGKRFVGTESRLKLLLEMISQLVQGTSDDKLAKVQSLQAQKALLEQQIVDVEQGMDSGLTHTQVRERLYLLSDLSRQLLGDFRQVEANFRALDKQTRKKITLGGTRKGKVLDKVFGDQDLIDDSDEGKSFSSFFELLMTAQMRENMRGHLKQILANPQGRAFVESDELLQYLYSYLLDAGTQVNHTKQQINDQLRRYIQEQSQDNKRILELIRDFEASALQVREQQLAEPQPFSQIDGVQAQVSSQFSRSLYQPKQDEQLNSSLSDAEQTPDVDLTSLFEVSRIDEFQLLRNIQKGLADHNGQVSLVDVIEQNPVQYGLDEVLTYIKLACEQTQKSYIDSEQHQHISWHTEQGVKRVLKIPTITFVRELS